MLSSSKNGKNTLYFNNIERKIQAMGYSLKLALKLAHYCISQLLRKIVLF